MILGNLVPNVMVEDVNATVEFYRDTLDFQLLASVPEEGQFNWAMLQNGETQLMFQSRASLTEEIPALQGRAIGGSMTFYIRTDDVKALHDRLKGHLTFVQEMHDTFYGAQEIAVAVQNGELLAFSQSVAE